MAMSEIFRFKRFVMLFISTILVLPGLVMSAESKTLKDYHMTNYKDVHGALDAFELFTKEENKRAFFGLSCSIQSPLPMLQILLFEDQIITDMPKLLSIKLFIDGVEQTGEFQGILKVVDNTEELSNKIRVELVTKRGSSLQTLQKQNQNLLEAMQKGSKLNMQLMHRTLETRTVQFSLSGLSELLKPSQKICF